MLGAGGAEEWGQPRAEACPPLAYAAAVVCVNYLIRRRRSWAELQRRCNEVKPGNIPELLPRNKHRFIGEAPQQRTPSSRRILFTVHMIGAGHIWTIVLDPLSLSCLSPKCLRAAYRFLNRP